MAKAKCGCVVENGEITVACAVLAKLIESWREESRWIRKLGVPIEVWGKLSNETGAAIEAHGTAAKKEAAKETEKLTKLHEVAKWAISAFKEDKWWREKIERDWRGYPEDIAYNLATLCISGDVIDYIASNLAYNEPIEGLEPEIVKVLLRAILESL